VTEASPTARELFEELAAERLRQPGVGRRRMFGSEGLSVNGKFFDFLNHDRLVMKLPPATATALIAAGDAVVADTLSPTIRAWVMVPMPARAAEDQSWRELIAAAHAHVGNAPMNGGRNQMERDMTRELVQAYYDSWKNGMASFDEGRLRSILAPDLKFEGPIAGKRDGLEPFLGGLADFVRKLKAYRGVQQLHAGNEASALYDCSIGVSAGTLRLAEFFRVQNGKVHEIKLLYDATEFRRLMAST
jgi:hypothetical protein